MEVKVGTCGWGYLNPSQFFPDWKEKFKDKLQAYVALFDVGEVNYTFYKLPDVKVMQLWRERADEIKPSFEFTLKAPKYITHIDKFQSQTSINEFNKTKELAKALRAKIIILQTPSSYKPTSSNIKTVREFFEKIDKEDFIVGWEFRGKEWLSPNVKEKVKKIFEDYNIMHVIDLFVDLPLKDYDGIVYTRLHGSPPGKKQYYYKFSDKDLEFLIKRLEELKDLGMKKVYVMFNNVWMYEDAKRFEEKVKSYFKTH